MTNNHVTNSNAITVPWQYRRLGHELVLGSIEDLERGEVDPGSIEDLDRLLERGLGALLRGLVVGPSDRLSRVLRAPGREAAADEGVHALDVQEDVNHNG